MFLTINKDICYKIVFFVFIFSLVLTPSFQLPWFRFKFQIVDFFMPIFIGMIYVNKWYKNWSLLYIKNLIFMSLIIFISLIVNRQWIAINDYFEIYRIFTYILVFIVFKEIYIQKFASLTIDIVFILLLIFNFLHYHNIFNFNAIVMPLYCGENSPHLFFFGYNSLLEPATKRMLGTLGNPNNNAILFLFFSILYFPKQNWSVKKIIFFFLSVVAVCSCQSRTGIIAFSVVFLLNYAFTMVKWWKMIWQLSAVAIIFILFFKISLLSSGFDFNFLRQQSKTESKIESKDYILSLIDGNAFSGNSWNVRLKFWKELSTQVLDKPIIGHAPRKNYFYEQKRHFENEYILYLWRYGILGFILFMGVYFIPVRKAFKTARSSEISKNTLLLIVVFAICGLTNVPLSNTTLSLLFFSYLGVFYSQKNKDYENLA